MASGSPPRGQMVALESHLLDRVQAAVILTDLAGVVVFANPYCEALYGMSPEDIVGKDAKRYSDKPVSPQLLGKVAHEIANGRSWEGEFQVHRIDGTVVTVRAIDSPVYDQSGRITGVLSLAFDVTSQRFSQDEMRRVAAVAQILRDIGETLTSELDADRLMQTTVDAARRLTGGSMGAFLRTEIDDDDAPFIVRATSGKAREASIGIALPADSELMRRAVTRERPARFEDLSLDDERCAEAVDLVMPSVRPPLRSCLVMPVRSRTGELTGMMLVAHPAADHFGRIEVQLLTDIAKQAGISLDVARLFRAAETEIVARRRAEEVQRFFAETSTVLSSSLDYPESFERVGRLCVPFLADLCLIDVAEERGVRRMAAVHADPEKQTLVREFETRYSPDPYGPHPAASVLRGGQSEVSDSINDEYLRTMTLDDRHFGIVKELEFTSFMCVPLEARGRTLGALTLVSSGSGRRFDDSDLALAEEFARRAGLALDNARLYSERDHVARALQSSLLPPSLPEIPGVRVTARYRAAGEGNEVGGDFYHVFPVDENAWWFIIGDVSGKGPEAAAIAGLARHTLRAVGLQERSPRRLLTVLHETLRVGEGRGEFCTVCCALLEPRDRGALLSVACAGHPPPVIRRSGGIVEVAACSGPLLGMPMRVDFVEQQLQLEPGDTVVLYTDGVTEAHHRNQELFGERRLADVVGRAGSEVDHVADDLLAAVCEYGPAEPRDDLAVVVVQIES